MSKTFKKLGVFSLLCASALPAFAAQSVDLSRQPVAFLKSLSPSPTLAARAESATGMKEVSQSIDFNQTLHVRMKQTYAGYPVWGGDAIVHIPHGQSNKSFAGLMAAADKAPSTMNGTVYQNLQEDLSGTPNYVFSSAQAEKALAKAIAHYEKQQGISQQVERKRSQLIVYIDQDNKAHWAFHVSFYLKPDMSRPALPNLLIDAVNLNIYRQWDEVKRLELDEEKSLEKVAGGGFGGNIKSGKVTYDGLPGNLQALTFQRDKAKNLCYLRNDHVTVADYRSGENKIVSFSCTNPNKDHNNVYWNGSSDEVNGGYSPNHDALYAGQIIKEMYLNWYELPPLRDPYNNPLMLTMVTHSPNYFSGRSYPDNAYWDPVKEKMYFGDGIKLFHPLTSLDVAAHEISHGFTEQNSGLIYDEQSGGMNEAFSDMAAQAAEYYAYDKKNSWLIGGSITKTLQRPVIRYMENPKDDCAFVTMEKPEGGLNCSLQNAKDYDTYIVKHKNDYDITTGQDNRIPNVHLSSGVYNRAFYLLANSPGWNVRKAFDVMLKANRNYWVPNSTFAQGACGVVSATEDYGYDLNAVYSAFDGVGINARSCILRIKK